VLGQRSIKALALDAGGFGDFGDALRLSDMA
jgi:hypothetical protein